MESRWTSFKSRVSPVWHTLRNHRDVAYEAVYWRKEDYEQL